MKTLDVTSEYDCFYQPREGATVSWCRAALPIVWNKRRLRRCMTDPIALCNIGQSFCGLGIGFFRTLNVLSLDLSSVICCHPHHKTTAISSVRDAIEVYKIIFLWICRLITSRLVLTKRWLTTLDKIVYTYLATLMWKEKTHCQTQRRRRRRQSLSKLKSTHNGCDKWRRRNKWYFRRCWLDCEND
jgi:hypothetical protein